MTKNCWRSIDAHFHDGAGRVLQSVLPIKSGKNTFMTEYNISDVWFPRMHDQKSLTLCWRSLSWWGREGIALCYANKGRQKLLYDLLQPIGGVVSQNAWPKIVDAPLTLIFMMGQGGYCHLFYLEKPAKIHLWLRTTYRRWDFLGRITKNCWCSVDGHFAMAVPTICNQLILHSPSFTLFWLPFWRFHLLSSWSLRCALIIHRYIE